MSTTFAKPAEVRADWYVVDAEGKTLGRLATQLAHRLKGKHKADYSPHVNMGDNLIVLNAGKVKVTGNKLEDKFYHQHTGYMGNLKSISLGKLLQEHPERALQFAVKGMLPKNTLGRQMYPQAACVCRQRASAHCPAAQDAAALIPGNHDQWQLRPNTAPAGASPQRRAST